MMDPLTNSLLDVLVRVSLSFRRPLLTEGCSDLSNESRPHL
jgi:hypothetical protein